VTAPASLAGTAPQSERLFTALNCGKDSMPFHPIPGHDSGSVRFRQKDKSEHDLR
jgi:hypothetical protein